MTGIAAKQLRSFIERIERVEEEVKGLNQDKSDIYKEAKSMGFDVKAMRIVIGMRRKDVAEIEEQNAIVGLYLHALGMKEIDLPEPSRVRVHMRDEEIDPETGEILEDRSPTAEQPAVSWASGQETLERLEAAYRRHAEWRAGQ